MGVEQSIQQLADDPVQTPQEGSVHVWLFGTLSRFDPERPVVLHLPRDFTAGDVVARLGERYGAKFLDRVLSAPGEKFSHCRLFVNGSLVEELDTPIETNGTATDIEMILLIAAEGG